MTRLFIPLSLALIALLLASCGGHVFHRVERGETLYSIGWVYGYDYRQIARWNNIPAPYALSPGQRIRVAPPSGQSPPPLQEYRASVQRNGAGGDSKRTPAPVVNAMNDSAKVVDKSRNFRESTRETINKTTSKAPQEPAPEPQKHDGQSVIDAAKKAVKKMFGQTTATFTKNATGKANWRWPTKSRRVLRTFSANNPSRQGLDIAGETGSPVLAAAKGRVVYAGSGLVRYGRLIIIKHNEKYLSAYAHNQKLRVKEGDVVQAGQRIADMGRSGNLGENFKNGQRAKLHFEIRRNGKPVDPKRYLPR